MFDYDFGLSYNILIVLILLLAVATCSCVLGIVSGCVLKLRSVRFWKGFRGGFLLGLSLFVVKTVATALG